MARFVSLVYEPVGQSLRDYCRSLLFFRGACVNDVGFYGAEGYLYSFLEKSFKPPGVFPENVKGIFFSFGCVSCDTDVFGVHVVSIKDGEPNFVFHHFSLY